MKVKILLFLPMHADSSLLAPLPVCLQDFMSVCGGEMRACLDFVQAKTLITPYSWEISHQM
jgi:hypothetical protein